MRRAVIAASLLGALAVVTTAEPLTNEVSNSDAANSTALASDGADEPSAAQAGLPTFAPPSIFERPPSVDAQPAAPSAPLVTPAADPDPADDTPSAALAEAGAAEAGKAQPGARLVPAKTVFGAMATPAPLAARSIGFYSRGCLAGAVPVPIDGETWQVMRLSRNRNWGHPRLAALVERLAEDGAAKDGWPGLLVGDLSQPRGGPMLTGHASHQIGLDADIWLTPMPDRRLSAEEREKLAATSMLGKDGIHADPDVFTAYHAAIIRRAASYKEVERVLVHPGIKKAMCEEKGVDRAHFHKIRPYWGHHYHMHIRIACPPDSTGCRTQAPTSGDDGCGAELDDWIKLLKKPPKPEPPVVAGKPRPPARPVTLDDLPAECRAVVAAGDRGGDGIAAGKVKGSKAAQTR